MDERERNPLQSASERSAYERTLYAWLRTGLAVVALGIVIIRLGYYLTEFARSTGVSLDHSALATPIGLLHVLLGLAVMVAASVRFLERASGSGVMRGDPLRSSSFLVLAMSAGSLIGGTTLALYLLALRP